MSELKPCPECGCIPKLHYTAGMSKTLREQINNPFVGAHPRWYILCQCSNNLVVEYQKGTYEEQQKAKRKLIREWNRRAQDGH